MSKRASGGGMLLALHRSCCTLIACEPCVFPWDLAFGF